MLGISTMNGLCASSQGSSRRRSSLQRSGMNTERREANPISTTKERDAIRHVGDQSGLGI